jgi:glycosyltransferase involved in cell wall biosynthesis
MLVDAISQMGSSQPVHLDIIGSGSEEEPLHEQISRLGIGDRVTFHGALPHAAIAERMREAHVFCLPSVRESGGAVLLEAMAAGRPVIAVAYGGPAEIVDETVGALLPAAGWATVVTDLTATLGDIFAHPAAWRERGLAGRRRVETQFSWPAKIESALALYQDCLESP